MTQELKDLYNSIQPPATFEEICEFEQKVDETLEDIESVRRNFLTNKCGFSRTSTTPGNVILYQKQLPDGRILLVDTNTAFYIARSIASTKETYE